MFNLVRMSRDGEFAIARLEDGSYARFNTASHDVAFFASLTSAMSGGSWRLSSAEDASTFSADTFTEIVDAAHVKLEVEKVTERMRTYRIPNSIRAAASASVDDAKVVLPTPIISMASMLATRDAISRDALVELRSMLTDHSDVLGGSAAQRWVDKLLSDDPQAVTAGAESITLNDKMLYFAGGDGSKEFAVDALYEANRDDDTYSEWVNGGWVKVGDLSALDRPYLVQLDDKTTLAVAEWLDKPDNTERYFELTNANPIEWNLFMTASAGIDWELLDRVTAAADQTWTSERAPQERTEVAGRQVRDSGGQFIPGEVAEKGHRLAVSARARLDRPMPMLADAASRIGDFIMESGKDDKAVETPDPTDETIVSAAPPMAPADAPAPQAAPPAPAPSTPAPQTDTVEESTPDTITARPLYLAVVDAGDTTAVLDLVAIIPAKAGSNQGPTAWRRAGTTWESSPDLLAQLQSVNPPPVVELTDDEDVKSVISQVDQHDASDPAQNDGGSTLAASGNVYRAITDNDGYDAWGESGEIVPIYASGVPGVQDTPKDARAANRLRQYWTHGEGAAKIGWGTDGDWYRCVSHLSKYMGTRAKGYCTLRHHDATGFYPGHAPGESAPRKGIRASASDSLNIAMFEQDVITMGLIAAGLSVSQMDDYAVPTMDPMADEPIPETASFDEGGVFVVPVLLPEQVESGDGRKFAPGALSTRDLPLPLLWQVQTADGHNQSVLVGRIDRIESLDEGGLGHAIGVFDTGPYGAEAERLVRGGFLRGISADLDRFEATVEEPEEQDAEFADGAEEEPASGNDIKNDKITVNSARLMAATLVPKPAFQECYIMMADGPDAQSPYMPGDPVEDGVYEEMPDGDEATEIALSAMAASAAPVKPPKSWFENPGLKRETPLTVDDDGRVFGHVAAWKGVTHIGLPNAVRPPRSASKYAYFCTGVLRTEDGGDVTVGQLTLAGGHASMTADARSAVKHYDDTASAVADVSCGEDEFGIWVAGSLRPSVTPEQVRVLRASAPSGDWRPINGRLELVAICQVNVPGFPIARAVVASGHVTALVAAGASYMAQLRDKPVLELAQRIEILEQREIDRERQRVLSRMAAQRESHREALVAAANAARARIRPADVTDVVGDAPF